MYTKHITENFTRIAKENDKALMYEFNVSASQAHSNLLVAILVQWNDDAPSQLDNALIQRMIKQINNRLKQTNEEAQCKT